MALQVFEFGRIHLKYFMPSNRIKNKTEGSWIYVERNMAKIAL